MLGRFLESYSYAFLARAMLVQSLVRQYAKLLSLSRWHFCPHVLFHGLQVFPQCFFFSSLHCTMCGSHLSPTMNSFVYCVWIGKGGCEETLLGNMMRRSKDCNASMYRVRTAAIGCNFMSCKLWNYYWYQYHSEMTWKAFTNSIRTSGFPPANLSWPSHRSL